MITSLPLSTSNVVRSFFGDIITGPKADLPYNLSSLAAINDQTDETQAEGGALSLPSIPARFALRFTSMMMAY